MTIQAFDFRCKYCRWWIGHVSGPVVTKNGLLIVSKCLCPKSNWHDYLTDQYAACRMWEAKDVELHESQD